MWYTDKAMTKVFYLLLMTFALTCLLAPREAFAACVNPAGNEGNQVYNTTYKTMQFCDGNTWISTKGGVGTDTLHAMSCADGEVVKWNDGATAWECATDSGLGAESDPKIDAVTSNKWCRGTGSQVTCDQDAPSGGSVPAGTWCGLRTVICTFSGTLYGTSDTFGGARACNGAAITVTCTPYGIGTVNCPSGYSAHKLRGTTAQADYTCIKT